MCDVKLGDEHDQGVLETFVPPGKQLCHVCRLLTTTFLLAHLMAQDLIRQAPAMLIRMQSSPALPSEAAPEQPDRRAGIPPSSSWAGSLAGDCSGWLAIQTQHVNATSLILASPRLP